MENKVKKIFRSGTTLAAAGVIGIASMVSGCFGSDEPGIIDTVNIMVDTGKAVVNFGINLSQWQDDVAEFIKTNEGTIRTACPEEMKKYEIEAANVKKSNESGSDDEKGDSLKNFTDATMDLLQKMAANDTLDSKLRTDADTLAKRYTAMYDEMKDALTKSMPDAGKDEINKALDEAFKPAK